MATKGRKMAHMPTIAARVDATGRQVSKTPDTVASYRARYLQLARTAGIDPQNYRFQNYTRVVDWFASQDNQWAPATISQYRGAIIQAIEDGVSNLTAEEVENLVARLAEGPSPRRSGPRRTSARKRKSIPRPEFVRLIQWLIVGRHPDDLLIARLLNHNVRLFLRRIEWQTAAVQDGFLVVRNAKATNGRALGLERRRNLGDYGAAGVRDLCDLLTTLTVLAAKAGGYKNLWGRLASRIARACKQVHIRRVAPYTTRHVGMANAKSWMSPAEVAASAGHKTTATATSHYAKRRTGWGDKVERVARPSAEDVEKVIKSPKASREQNLNEQAERRAEREAEEEAAASSFKM
jgi:hypothetical protein